MLQSLIAMEGPGHEVLLVDNGSREGEWEFLRCSLPSALHITTLRLPKNRGYVKGVNAGLEHLRDTSGPLFLVNSDLVFHELRGLQRWLHTLEEHPQVGIIGPKPPKFLAAGRQSYYQDHAVYGHWVTGCIMLLSGPLRSMLVRLDEAYGIGYWDDADLCMECFWIAHKDVMGLSLCFEHKAGTTGRRNGYRLTDQIKSYEDLRIQRARNRERLFHKWSSVLYPRRKTLEEEMEHLQMLRELRKSYTVPGYMRLRWNLPSPILT